MLGVRRNERGLGVATRFFFLKKTKKKKHKEGKKEREKKKAKAKVPAKLNRRHHAMTCRHERTVNCAWELGMSDILMAVAAETRSGSLVGSIALISVGTSISGNIDVADDIALLT